tara:strand:+ start:294 stop:857 length:564 start_codon:yes stop_codon:yes gene_type:complete
MRSLLLIIGIIFLSGCYITGYTYDPIYEDRPHSTEVYYWNDSELGGSPYWGYWGGFYYYYGTPHFYPWWYYYQFIPPTYYNSTTHITIICDSGYYVYGHRGPLFHNIGPSCPINRGKFTPTIKLNNNKDKSFVFPRDWKSSNSTRINKHNDNKIIINNRNNTRNNSIIKNKSRNNVKLNNKTKRNPR